MENTIIQRTQVAQNHLCRQRSNHREYGASGKCPLPDQSNRHHGRVYDGTGKATGRPAAVEDEIDVDAQRGLHVLRRDRGQCPGTVGARAGQRATDRLKQPLEGSRRGEPNTYGAGSRSEQRRDS